MKHSELLTLVVYYPETGVFSKKELNYSEGYKGIYLKGKIHLSHRLAWFYMTGEWPSMCIDHINRVRTDNRWSNLRLVTQMQNAQNRNYKANQSGFTGVYPYKKSGKWTSEVRVSRKKYNLGQFATAEAAYNARLLKIQDLRAAQP